MMDYWQPPHDETHDESHNKPHDERMTDRE